MQAIEQQWIGRWCVHGLIAAATVAARTGRRLSSSSGGLRFKAVQPHPGSSGLHGQLSQQGVELIGSRNELQQATLIRLRLKQLLLGPGQAGLIGREGVTLGLERSALCSKPAELTHERQQPGPTQQGTEQQRQHQGSQLQEPLWSQTKTGGVLSLEVGHGSTPNCCTTLKRWAIPVAPKACSCG